MNIIKLAKQNIFQGDESNTPAPAANTPPTDATTTLLSTIKGEDGQQKYATVEVALQALQASQEFIPGLQAKNQELEASNAVLKQAAETQGTLEDTIASVLAKQSAPATPEAPAPVQTPAATEALSLADVQSVIDGNTAKATSDANELRVSNAFTSQYGDKAAETMLTRIAAVGMTKDSYLALARTSPDAALQMMQVSAQPQTNVTPGSNLVPVVQPQANELKPPEKSLLVGATSKDVQSYLAEIKKVTWAKHGITGE